MQSPEGRAKIAQYCLRDSELVADLIEKLHLLVNAVELSRVCGATLNDVLHRGQQVKVGAVILKACRLE